MAIGRRDVLKRAALVVGAGTVGAGPSVAMAAEASCAPRNTKVVARADTAIVEIATGKIAGYIGRGVYAFKGIPYAATTAGENRFLPPQKPTSWTGVRSSRQYGLVCPQDKGMGRLHDEEAFIFHWNDSVEGDDCLRVNVWTPDINDNKKRPVMVWLHGGGFSAGSGNDIPAFDGENLARKGDVVVVTLNHRLNLLGYMDLSKYGEKYAQSGNVGMLDIVAALEWVRDNIAVFGGDPGRVLILGQSGGGAKVGTLMGMPSAKGLFHRAVVESGSFSFFNTPDRSQKLAELMLAELSLPPSTVDRIQTIPYATLQAASVSALRKANAAPANVLNVRSMASRLDFTPVVDGTVLPFAPFGPDAPGITAAVPMIIGTTLNEFANGINQPDFDLMTEAQLDTRVEALHPGHAKQVIAAFRARTPKAKPVDLYSRIASAPVRQAAIRQAASKAALNKAQAYLYWFTWQTPIFDGRPRAFHCAEIPFVFGNTDSCANMTGGGDDARALSDKMLATWVQFAKTGNPNHPGIPRWQPYSSKAAPTMIFDDRVEALLDPDGREQAAIGAG